MRLAGIDIGTLTCRLLIANVIGSRSIELVHSDRKILKLGEGVDQDKRLKPEAITRVVETIREWRKQIDEHKVKTFTAVATSAVREARNREEFLALVKTRAGVEVEVIDGEEEARLTLMGIRSALPRDVSEVLALDIGGGSTEFILSCQNQKPVVSSVDMGVVRITERFFNHDPPTRHEVNEALHCIQCLTKEAISKHGQTEKATLVGTAGTITTLSAMAQGLTKYDPAKIHHHLLHLSTIQAMEKDLFHRTSVERRGIPGLEPGREDVIAAGVLILRSIMELLGFDRCLVSEYGLREGVLVDLAQRNISMET